VHAAGFGTSQVEGTVANLGYLGDGTITLGNAAAAPKKTPQPGTATPGLPVATGQPANSGPTPTALVLRTPIPVTATAVVQPTATATFTPTPTNTVVLTPTPSPTTTAVPTPQPLLSPSITLYPGTQTAGAMSGVTVTGGGFQGSESISVSYVASRPDGSTVVEQRTGTAFPNGTFVIPNLPVPADVGAGSYQVTAVGQSSGKSASASLTVVPAPTATPTNTLLPNSTATPTNTLVPTATVTPTAALTSTPTPTFTATASRTSNPKAAVLIDKVLILRHVNGRNVASQQVRVNQAADFFVLYHLANAGRLKPSASLTVTRNGRPMKVPKLHSVTLGHHAAFTARITFTHKKATGKFYAHFHLNLGSASVKRDRKFYVAGG